MSAYENVVEGKLRLKGKPLHVFKANAEAADARNNKRKKHKHRSASHFQGENSRLSTNPTDGHTESEKYSSEANAFEDNLTPAERKFLQQTYKLELQKLAKTATKSHRDRIQEFNQYLANLTEHYDIPKVGPG